MDRLVKLHIGACVVASLLWTASCAADPSDPGPYQAGWTEVDVRRPDNSTFKAVLYYPASTPGSGGAYDPSGAPYPAVSFGHGFLQPVEQYQSTLTHLATWGYFVMASRSAGGLFPNHAQFAEDLSSCLTFLEVENADPASPLYQQVAVERFGMSGHSMGGGASILATADDPRVKALANLAAAETRPSAVDAMPAIRVPVRLICGSEDTITPPTQHGVLMYDNGNVPKQLPLIVGGFHCGFVDEDFLFCDSGSISRETQLRLTRGALTAFFNLYLKGDQANWRLIWGPDFLADPAYDTTRSEPGAALDPPSTILRAPEGTALEVELTLRSTRLNATRYELATENNAWTTLVTPTWTPPLSNGQAAPVAVKIDIPAGPGPDADTALISARAELDGGTRTFAALETRRWYRGDLNCDDAIDFGDINPFVLALSDPAGYAKQFPDCDHRVADINFDGRVDFDDINPFVDLLTSTAAGDPPGTQNAAGFRRP